MEAMHRDAIHAHKALPRRGVETGGILLGHADAEGICVRNYHPLPCEHRFGPTWRLSDADVGVLEAALESLRQGDLKIVGMYRSDTSLDPRPTPEDRRLFEGYFPEPESVFLLIHPGRQQPTTAAAFFWNNGELEPAGTAVRFPFAEEAAARSARVPTLRSIRARQVLVPPVMATTPRPVAAPPAAAASRAIAPTPPVPPGRAVENAAPVAPPQTGELARTVEPRFVVPELPPRPDLYRSEPPPKRLGLWAAAIALVAVLAAVGLIGSRWLKVTPPSVPAINEAFRTNTPPLAASTPAAPSTPEVPAAASPSAASETTAPARPRPLNVEIRSVLDEWAAAAKTGDPERMAHFYAPRLSSYLGRRNATNADVRGRISYLYGRYGRPILFRIDRLSISRSGRERAVATFRKYWQTSAHFTGQERTQVAFTRQNGEWKIASETTLRTDFIHRLK